MIEKKAFLTLGLLFFVVGVAIMINSFQGITGFAIFESYSPGGNLSVSMWFLLASMLILHLGRGR